jgi:hypothetical protein
MVRWCTLALVLLVVLGLPKASRAQSGYPSGPGVVPAGHSAQAGYVKQKPAAYGPVGPLPEGPGRTIYRELPDDTGWIYEDTPLERMLKDSFRHSYFRVEYLLWDISDPGKNVLGAPTAILNASQLSPNDPSDPDYPSTIDPTLSLQQQYVYQPFRGDVLTPFQVSNPIDGNTSLIAVVAPSTQDVLINENNGIRMTFGLPAFEAGTFEASIFALQSSRSDLARQPIPRFDNSYDSDGDFQFGQGDPNETFIGTGIGEFDRNGNGLVDDVVNDFEAFATPIYIDGAVPVPNRTPPTDPTTGLPFDPATGQPVTPPFLWPSIRNPLGQTVGPPGTILDPRGRGDNFRIVWAIRNPDPVDALINPFLNTYQAALKTSVWGTEANWISSTGLDNGGPFTVRPMIGFRYAYYAEDLRQSGAYTFVTTNPVNGQLVDNTINRKIDSTTINNLYGPQLGLRMEATSKWFTIGAQPKVMMGLNTYKANLATGNVLRPSADSLGQAAPTNEASFLALGDTDQDITENASTFGVVGDLELYSRVRLTNYLHAFVGYNFMWAGMITRPADNIYYNAKTVLIDPNLDPNDTNTATRLDSDFRLKVDYSGAIIQGLTLGAELRY